MRERPEQIGKPEVVVYHAGLPRRAAAGSGSVSDYPTNQDLTGFHVIIPKTMHRKRLQHVADTMCQMFCGWRLIESKPNLVNLGSGTLEIDAMTGQCLFQGKTIGQLTIAEEIHAWLQQNLATNKIPIAIVTGAHLAVKLSFSVVPWNEPTREIFYSAGKVVRTEKMNRCVMECDSNVSTDEAMYHSKLMEAQEWPLGWPGNASSSPLRQMSGNPTNRD